MRKKLVLAVACAAVEGALLIPAGSGSAASTGVCALNGTAKVNPPLTLKKHSFTFSFAGKLSSCTGTGNAKSGTLSASGTGSGTCASTKGSGSASIKWNTGQSSAISFSFSGTGNVVTVNGKVNSGLFAGQSVKAQLAFTKTTPAPTACTSSGVSSFSFTGAAEL